MTIQKPRADGGSEPRGGRADRHFLLFGRNHIWVLCSGPFVKNAAARPARAVSQNLGHRILEQRSIFVETNSASQKFGTQNPDGKGRDRGAPPPQYADRGRPETDKPELNRGFCDGHHLRLRPATVWYVGTWHVISEWHVNREWHVVAVWHLMGECHVMSERHAISA